MNCCQAGMLDPVMKAPSQMQTHNKSAKYCKINLR